MPTYFLFHHPCSIPLVPCSYLIILWVFPTWYQLLYIYLLLYARAYDTVFMFMIQIYQYTCAYPYSPSGFRITTRRGVLTPLDPHVQVLELEAVDSPSCWSEWHSGSVDLQQTVQSLILPGPLFGSRVFLLWLGASICTVHTCILLGILAFAPYWWCNIIVILCHIWW